MKPYELFWKNSGETPLEALGRFRVRFPEYAAEKLSYAGRLDPLAEGELLILIGETNKKREQYLGFDKEYEFTVLFGVSTDTHDLLGMVESVQVPQTEISIASSRYIGENLLPYPAYSSKTVEGKPLFAWAREGKLKEIVVPQQHSRIVSLEETSRGEISSNELLIQLEKIVAQVSGDFRQEKIIKKWKEALSFEQDAFPLVSFRARVGSGTYIRSLVHLMGKEISVPSLAYAIRRTRIFIEQR